MEYYWENRSGCAEMVWTYVKDEQREKLRGNIHQKWRVQWRGGVIRRRKEDGAKEALSNWGLNFQDNERLECNRMNWNGLTYMG